MNEPTPAAASIYFEGDVVDAVLHGDIEPVYQPIFALSDGQPLGFEVLARWRCARRGTVLPVEFLPVAERSGLIRRIDLTMADRAMELCSTLGEGAEEPFVSVNFSARLVRDGSLATTLRRMLDQRKLSPSRLRVEIAESTMNDDLGAAPGIMAELKEVGVKLALDDFGTDLSSLDRLRRMPADILKIDCSLATMPQRRHTAIRAIIELSQRLGIEVVAEGIEDAATAEALLEWGCRIGQGFHLAPPMPTEQVVALWRSNRRR
jgi:diguanylate cyclase